MILFFYFSKTFKADDKIELFFFFQIKSPLILLKFDSNFSFPKEMLEIHDIN